jgi:hypothetical protein
VEVRPLASDDAEGLLPLLEVLGWAPTTIAPSSGSPGCSPIRTTTDAWRSTRPRSGIGFATGQLNWMLQVDAPVAELTAGTGVGSRLSLWQCPTDPPWLRSYPRAELARLLAGVEPAARRWLLVSWTVTRSPLRADPAASRPPVRQRDEQRQRGQHREPNDPSHVRPSTDSAISHYLPATAFAGPRSSRCRQGAG